MLPVFCVGTAASVKSLLLAALRTNCEVRLWADGALLRGRKKNAPSHAEPSNFKFKLSDQNFKLRCFGGPLRHFACTRNTCFISFSLPLLLKTTEDLPVSVSGAPKYLLKKQKQDKREVGEGGGQRGLANELICNSFLWYRRHRYLGTCFPASFARFARKVPRKHCDKTRKRRNILRGCVGTFTVGRALLKNLRQLHNPIPSGCPPFPLCARVCLCVCDLAHVFLMMRA